MSDIDSIEEVFGAVGDGLSVLLYMEHTTSSGETRKEKLWQLEKSKDHKYLYKTYHSSTNTIHQKYPFIIDPDKTDGDMPIRAYYRNFRKCLCEIMTYIEGREEHIKKLSPRFLIYDGYTLNYTNKENWDEKFVQDRKHKFFVKISKTRTNEGARSPSVPKSGENEIRVVLNTYIEEHHPNGHKWDEYATYSSSSRADTVVFCPDMIHTYEIKSKKDSFARLETQIKDYKKYSERVTVVLDESKVKGFLKRANLSTIYNGVEVLVYRDRETPLRRVVRGKKQTLTDSRARMLWKDELYSGLLPMISGVSGFSSAKLIKVAEKIYTKRQLNEAVLEILHNRYRNANKGESIECGTINMMRFMSKHELSSPKLWGKAETIIKELQKNR